MVLAFLFGGSALGEGQRGADSQTKAEGTSSKQNFPLSLAPESSYSGLIDQRACQPSQDSHQADLCVAWRAAKAAENQAFWAAAAFWVGLGGVFFVIRTLHHTRKAAEAAQASVQAAERSVAESAKTLAHAQDVAARDLRPWLTVEAFLDGPITVDELSDLRGDGDRLEFYAKLRVQNVGKSAARNAVYRISAADFGEIPNPDEWFESTVEEAVSAARACLPASWDRVGFDLDRYNDSLAPSESYESRRWCSFEGTAPANQPVWKGYEFCVSVVAAYMGTTDDQIFYTAKVFPIGFPQVPTFQRFIRPNDLPIGTGDVAFGPVRKARAT